MTKIHDVNPSDVEVLDEQKVKKSINVDYL